MAQIECLKKSNPELAAKLAELEKQLKQEKGDADDKEKAKEKPDGKENEKADGKAADGKDKPADKK